MIDLVKSAIWYLLLGFLIVIGAMFGIMAFSRFGNEKLENDIAVNVEMQLVDFDNIFTWQQLQVPDPHINYSTIQLNPIQGSTISPIEFELYERYHFNNNVIGAVDGGILRMGTAGWQNNIVPAWTWAYSPTVLSRTVNLRPIFAYDIGGVVAPRYVDLLSTDFYSWTYDIQASITGYDPSSPRPPGAMSTRDIFDVTFEISRLDFQDFIDNVDTVAINSTAFLGVLIEVRTHYIDDNNLIVSAPNVTQLNSSQLGWSMVSGGQSDLSFWLAEFERVQRENDLLRSIIDDLSRSVTLGQEIIEQQRNTISQLQESGLFGGVWGFLGGVFGVIVPFLSIELLPNITVGLLFIVMILFPLAIWLLKVFI